MPRKSSSFPPKASPASRSHRRIAGFSRWRRSERGQSIVEITLVLPVILLMVLASLDFGRLFMGWVVLNNASRVGANYAALHAGAWDPGGNPARRTTYGSLVTNARNDTEMTLNGCSSAPVPSPGFPAGKDIGDYAELTLDCSFTPITPMISEIFNSIGTPLQVTARSVFPIRAGAIAGPALTPLPSCLSNFSWQVDPGDSLTVDFTDLTPPTAAGWIWDMGDSQGSALQHPQWTYAAAGSYTVTLSSYSGAVGCVPYVEQVTVVAPGPSPGPPSSPGPSPTPAPSATPQPGCGVPSFIGTKKNDSAASWTTAGFTTPITYNPNPNGNWTIEFQSLVGGQTAPCNTPVTLGPDPAPTPAP